MSFMRGVILVVAASIMWGVSGVCGQFLFQNYHTNAGWLITVRQFVAGALFLGYLLYRGRSVFRIFHNKADTIELLAFTFLGLLGAQYGFYYNVSLSNAATATVLQYTAPIFVVLWGAYVHKRQPEGREILGIVLALVGVFMISTHGQIDELVISPEALFWGGISAVALAFYMVVPGNILKKYTTMEVMGWGQMLSGVFLSFFFNPLDCGTGWDAASIAAMGYIVLLGTVAAFTLFLQGVIIIGPTKASLISCAEPLSSILCVVAFLGTRLGWADIFGMLCIIVTVLLLSITKK